MKRMLGARCSWIQCLTRLKQHAHLKPFCTKTKLTSSNNGDGRKNSNGSASSSYEDAYRQLDKLDFMTAAKILFTSPPKDKKKFGLDFHLVQLFFTCLPSLAVYLVALYARYEIRRMEAELEVKKAQEEEEEAAAKAKELESNGDEEKVAEISPEILKVNERLDKLEETIKEIVSEPKKQMDLVSKDHQKDSNNTSAKRPEKTTDQPSHSSSNEDSTNEKMKRSAEPGPVSSPVDQIDNQKRT